MPDAEYHMTSVASDKQCLGAADGGFNMTCFPSGSKITSAKEVIIFNLGLYTCVFVSSIIQKVFGRFPQNYFVGVSWAEEGTFTFQGRFVQHYFTFDLSEVEALQGPACSG